LFKKNHVVIYNELGPGLVLNIACRRDSIVQPPTWFHSLNFKDPFYFIQFEDHAQPKDTKSDCMLKVYRQCVSPKCGQLRSWIANTDGIWFTRRYHSPPGHDLNWKT
ncbi:hypothetical protein CARUB_v10012298mg, partial [Capsella rubella]